MGIFRRRAKEPVPTPDPAVGKSGRRVRMLKRLVMWLAPFAIDSLLRRRKGGEGRGLGGRFRKK